MFFDLQSFIALSQKTNLTSQEKLLLFKFQIHFKKNIDLLQKLYDYSLVAYCANVYLNQSLKKEGLQKHKAIIKALTNPFYKKEKIPVGGLNNVFLALKFVKNYEILEHINETHPQSKMGFRANFIYDKKRKNYILAFAGSDLNPLCFDFKDFYSDFLILLNKTPKGQIQSMQYFYNQLKQKYTIDKNLIIIGHSLGGYLAQTFARTFPSVVKEVYAFQAPGLRQNFQKYSYINFHINTTYNLNFKTYKWWNFNFVQKLYEKDSEEILLRIGSIKHHPSVCIYKLDEFFKILNP
ncbi:alpha/beta fold hydrolase [Campylobacter armoricus]|uniref:alpha/beta fold hydrolase n=1 Tax=Campylobacter armoricus TaxID=2505970 RepID=UPI0011167196|nr:alpha/beta fold hydrolase [Campylobacter armoricus]